MATRQVTLCKPPQLCGPQPTHLSDDGSHGLGLKSEEVPSGSTSCGSSLSADWGTGETMRCIPRALRLTQCRCVKRKAMKRGLDTPGCQGGSLAESKPKPALTAHSTLQAGTRHRSQSPGPGAPAQARGLSSAAEQASALSLPPGAVWDISGDLCSHRDPGQNRHLVQTTLPTIWLFGTRITMV